MNTDQPMHDLNPYVLRSYVFFFFFCCFVVVVFFHIIQKLVANWINLLSSIVLFNSIRVEI